MTWRELWGKGRSPLFPRWMEGTMDSGNFWRKGPRRGWNEFFLVTRSLGFVWPGGHWVACRFSGPTARCHVGFVPYKYYPPRSVAARWRCQLEHGPREWPAAPCLCEPEADATVSRSAGGTLRVGFAQLVHRDQASAGLFLPGRERGAACSPPPAPHKPRQGNPSRPIQAKTRTVAKLPFDNRNGSVRVASGDPPVTCSFEYACTALRLWC